MSSLWIRCTLVLFLVFVVVPVTGVHSVPAVEGAARGPSIAPHGVLRADLLTSFDVRKLSGDYKLIVILVEFNDVKHETSRDTLSDMVFRRMSQYWREVSYGRFNVIGDTVGWIDVGRDEAYYGKDTDPKDPGSDQRRSELVADACRLTTGVDFSQYEDMMVVHAGHGQDQYTYTKNTDLLWPFAYWRGLDVTCGSKRFDHGGVSAEVTEDGLDIGAFTHEFGHTIGLPDLYNGALDAPDYWKTGIDHAGLWSLMALGSWGGPDHDASSPIGLEAWSKIKLGWLSSISAPLTREGFVQALKQIGDTTGQRAMKLAAGGSSYYLIEVREKTGVDQYLPNSGVLITRVDESKDSAEGILVVMDCHPETKTINDATCRVNESWSDKRENIYVKVIGKQDSSYIVAVASIPITALKGMYTVELSLTGVPSSAKAAITVDGTEYGTTAEIGNPTLMFPLGSSHTITLSQYVMLGEDIRYYAADNTITVTKQGTYTISYLQQNRLLIVTPTRTGEKWLTPDKSETLGPYDEVIQADAGTRYLFPSIVVDGVTRQSRSVTVTMDRPHTVKVNYTKQYLLTIDSEFGDPKGGGWHDAGSETKYSVTSPCGFLTQRIFVSWTGDVSSSEPQGTLTMTRPRAIKANWREDYTQLILLIVLLAVVVCAIALKARTRWKAPSPSDAQELRTVGTAPTEAYDEDSHWCISCGRRIMQDSIFCEHCGARQPE